MLPNWCFVDVKMVLTPSQSMNSRSGTKRVTSCIPSLPSPPQSVSPLNSIVLIPCGYDFNTEESNGAIKSKDALCFQNGGVCNGKNGSSKRGSAIPPQN